MDSKFEQTKKIISLEGEFIQHLTNYDTEIMWEFCYTDSTGEEHGCSIIGDAKEFLGWSPGSQKEITERVRELLVEKTLKDMGFVDDEPPTDS